MAIDGVGIIDSDGAYDIYNFVTDGWKAGTQPAALIGEVRSWEASFCFAPMETEIFWTAFAYALWKIGELPDDIHSRMLEVVAVGASPDWLKIDPNAQPQRQRRLDQLTKKLETPNLRPLRRPASPRQPMQPLYSRGDVLAVTLPTGQYGACILVELELSPRKIEYNFAIVNLFLSTPPTLDDVRDATVSFSPRSDRLPDGGFTASCWTNQKVITAVHDQLNRIGSVDLASARMLAYSPAVTAEKFYRCWEGISVDRDIHPVSDCVEFG